MELQCYARLVTLFVRNSFKRLIPSLIVLGIKAKDPLDPLLVLVTSNILLEFKVTSNVRRVYKKEILQGRLGIEFCTPPHQVLITAVDAEELSIFLALFCKLMDRAVMERLEYIPILFPSTMSTFPKGWRGQLSHSEKPRKIPLNLKERISKYVKEIDLPECQLKKIPVELGEISIERINLENNEISNENLTFLQELPIRKSLKYLNLAENEIDVFPSVLCDFESLIDVNFRDNAIKTIPHGIDQLRTLKYLNMSGNNLHYLPATLEALRLSEADLTYNYLTSNIRASYQPKPRNASRNCLSLRDLALISVGAPERRELTYKQCPKILLEHLRQVSKCLCGRRTVPYPDSPVYEALFRVCFALNCKIHPQKLDFTDEPLHGIRHKGNGIGNLFIESYLCGNCEDEYRLVNLSHESEYFCFRLLES